MRARRDIMSGLIKHGMRHWIARAACGIAALCLVIAASVPANSFERRRSRIANVDVVLSDMSLKFGFELWHLNGNVTNNSPFELQGFILMVQMLDCHKSCVIVGEEYVTVGGLRMPPLHKRKFQRAILFRNLPKVRKRRVQYFVIRTFEDLSEYEYYMEKRIRRQ